MYAEEDSFKKQNISRISVITVVFNGVREIEKTIQSTIQQEYPFLEYIIIDGGSTDGTLDVIKKYESRISYWISEPDNGIYDAMNKGIDKANGEWINFMNVGDRFASADVISKIFSGKTYDADILYGDAMVEYPDFETLWKKIPISEMWKRTPFCHQACFSKSALMKTSKFDLRYKLSSDYNFLYKAHLAGKKFEYIDQIVCYYNYKDGASIKYETTSLMERRKIVLGHSLTLKRWFYYFRITIYIGFVSNFKKVIGKRITGWVTTFLKA